MSKSPRKSFNRKSSSARQWKQNKIKKELAENGRNLRAASPIGQTVTVTCTLIAHKDRKFQFAIEAIDNQQLVAQGYHERVLVDADKFMKKISDK